VKIRGRQLVILSTEVDNTSYILTKYLIYLYSLKNLKVLNRCFSMTTAFISHS
jgi:hypothetical protein